MSLPFWLLFAFGFNLLVTGMAVFKGGPPERFCALFLFVGAQAAFLMPDRRWMDVQFAVLWLDAAYFIILTLFALHVDRWWPLWTAAFQGLCVAVHLAFWAQERVISLTYITALNVFGYGVTATVGIGVLLHIRRTRLSVTGGPVPLRRTPQPVAPNPPWRRR